MPKQEGCSASGSRSNRATAHRHNPRSTTLNTDKIAMMMSHARAVAARICHLGMLDSFPEGRKTKPLVGDPDLNLGVEERGGAYTKPRPQP